jgi:secretory carrier-associated membrane protein
MAACIVLFVGGSPDGTKDMISGIIYFPILTVLAFLLWYRPAYNGFMKEHSIFYYVYFVFMGFHLAYSVYAFLGIPSTGCAGLISLIQSFSNGRIVAGILSVITTAAVAVQGLGNLWYYREIWKHNNEQGHTFAQAKQELATHGAKVRNTRDAGQRMHTPCLPLSLSHRRTSLEAPKCETPCYHACSAIGHVTCMLRFTTRTSRKSSWTLHAL